MTHLPFRLCAELQFCRLFFRECKDTHLLDCSHFERRSGIRDVIAPLSLISSYVKRTFDRILYFNILLRAVSRFQDLRRTRLPREIFLQPLRRFARSFVHRARFIFSTLLVISAANRNRDICRLASARLTRARDRPVEQNL